MQEITISFNRKTKSDDMKLRYLLRSIEKYIDADAFITIIGDVVEHIVDVKKVNFILSPSPDAKTEYEKHAKNVCAIVNTFNKCFFVFNGTVFVKPLKKSNYKQMASFSNHLVEVPANLAAMYNYTIKDLRQKKLFSSSSLPTVFFPYDFSLVKKYRYKYPELFSETMVFPIVYVNLIPKNAKTEFKKDSFIIKNVTSFAHLDNLKKNTRALFLNTKLNDAYYVKLDRMFPKKSKWEI